ncbi:MAG TPA: hypothetical protein VFU15_05470 [Bacteroidia bacterium]|nr:hypothetical protein [Bacteroidia bacterium]
MRKKILLLLLFTAVLAPLFAQMEITWGVPQKEPHKTYTSEVLGESDGYLYSVRSVYSIWGPRNPFIERYRMSDMSLDYSKELALDAGDKARSEEGIFLCGNTVVVFASYYDKDRSMNVLQGEVLDDHCVAKTQWKEIARIDASKKANPGSFYLGLGQDSVHFLIVINPPYDKYANEKFRLDYLRTDLSPEWEKEIVPPYQDQYFSLTNFIASETGDVYMLATISKDKSVMTKKERRTQPTYYHTVLMYSAASDSLREYKVSIDPKFISDIRMTVNDSGDIICSGFYSNKSSNAIVGTFYLRIDRKTSQVSSIGTKDFDQDFLTQFMSAKKASEGKELYDYDLKHLVLRDDGGAVLVAEQYYEVLVQTYDPATKMYSYTYYYYYNDIIVISIDSSGAISWAKKIPKYQVSRNDGGYYSSFAFAVSGDRMYFMFNDSPRNTGQEDSRHIHAMNNPRKSVAVLVTMDSKGNIDRQAMFSNRDLKIVLRPKLFMQFNEHRMLLYGEKGSTFKFADVRM